MNLIDWAGAVLVLILCVMPFLHTSLKSILWMLLKMATVAALFALFLELVLEALRATLLIRYAPELRASLESELGADEFSALEKFAEPNVGPRRSYITHQTMLAFLTATERIRYAPIPALPLELAVLELFAE